MNVTPDQIQASIVECEQLQEEARTYGDIKSYTRHAIYLDFLNERLAAILNKQRSPAPQP